MLHNLLPTQVRLNRMNLPNAPTPNCTQCGAPDNLVHALITCPQNRDVSDWLVKTLKVHCPSLSPNQMVLLDIGDHQEDLELAIVWLVAKVLGEIWKLRKEKKTPRLYQTRAMLEAGVVIMRKTRLKNTSTILETFIST